MFPTFRTRTIQTPKSENHLGVRAVLCFFICLTKKSCISHLSSENYVKPCNTNRFFLLIPTLKWSFWLQSRNWSLIHKWCICDYMQYGWMLLPFFSCVTACQPSADSDNPISFFLLLLFLKENPIRIHWLILLRMTVYFSK